MYTALACVCWTLILGYLLNTFISPVLYLVLVVAFFHFAGSQSRSSLGFWSASPTPTNTPTDSTDSKGSRGGGKGQSAKNANGQASAAKPLFRRAVLTILRKLHQVRIALE